MKPYVLVGLSIILAVAALFFGVSYPVGQARGQQDPRRCTPSTNPASRRWVPADVVARPEFQQMIQDCIGGRREECWGPWDAWGPLIRRNED